MLLVATRLVNVLNLPAFIDFECGLCFWICTCTHITTKKQGCSFTTTNEMSEMGDVVLTELGADDASVLKGKSR